MNRRQFSIPLGYCLTINRAQGQFFDAIGIVSNNAVFSYGQLYVALTRSRIQHSIKVCLKHDDMYPDTKNKRKYLKSYIKNIVYKEIFEGKNHRLFHIANFSKRYLLNLYYF